MDPGHFFRHLTVILYMVLHITTAAPQQGLNNNVCQSFRDCGRDTLLSCINNVCQCGPYQYYEPSMGKCVGMLGEYCDSSTLTRSSRDDNGLPKIQCGPTAACAQVRHAKYPYTCQCRKNFVKTGDRCVEPVTQTPAPRISHPKYTDSPQIQDSIDASNTVSHEKLEDFPFHQGENHKPKSASSSLAASLTCFVITLCVSLHRHITWL